MLLAGLLAVESAVNQASYPADVGYVLA